MIPQRAVHDIFWIPVGSQLCPGLSREWALAMATNTQASRISRSRNMTPLALVATGLAFVAPAAFAQTVGQQCYILLGEQTLGGDGKWTPSTGPDRGSALFTVGNGSVRLWFRRDASEFDQMSHGAKFDDVTKGMLAQGDRPASTDAAGIHFGNGQRPVEAVYTLQINGGAVSGNIKNPQGKYFSARGTCGAQQRG
jgi:hypothetical protein